jgi:serine protease AprX
MRQDRTLHKDVRANALWGRRGESRSNALWGRSGKRMLVLLSLVAMLVVPVAGSASPGKALGKVSAVVPDSLLAQAAANPDQQFDVIVQGDKGSSSSNVADNVDKAAKNSIRRRFMSIAGVEATLSGKDLLKLASFPHVLAITPNVKTTLADYQDATMWQDSTDMSVLQNSFDPNTGAITGPAPQAPAIAIVDSGVQARADFGSRLVAGVNMCSLCSPTASGDDEGHGTMVAGVAAGSSSAYPGGAPNAPIVSIRTADAKGESLESDVIAAADWIDAHAKQYNIRVANFSLATASDTSIRVDPLDKAVERLWLDGIVVVAAAGNHGSASGPVSMSYAPGNDPFVITVGAVDQHMTSDPSDDDVPYWSAYGTSMDGFSKPDVSAPGRYMIAPVPMGATIPTTVPDRVVTPGYMWMSGTSFAAPVVSAEAAQILARHPGFTPDQVKGAIMLSSNYLPNVNNFSDGVGEVDGGVAASMSSAPNPNEGLYQFVSGDPLSGKKVFDAASWATFLSSGASWAQASWGEASWGEASWNAASWGEASWNAASWVANVNGQMTTLTSYSESTFTP